MSRSSLANCRGQANQVPTVGEHLVRHIVHWIRKKGEMCRVYLDKSVEPGVCSASQLLFSRPRISSAEPCLSRGRTWTPEAVGSVITLVQTVAHVRAFGDFSDRLGTAGSTPHHA